MSSKIATAGWRYSRCGPVSSVLKYENFHIAPKKGEAIVRMLLAPLHRTDAAIINGTALSSITKRGDFCPGEFPRVGGCEGVGQVVRLKENGECSVKEGDMVWVSPCFQGTWAKEIAVSGKQIHKIKPEHANLACTASSAIMAEHLLYGYCTLKPGDVVMQSGGSSLTALTVSAIAQKQLSGVTVLTLASPGERFAEAASRHSEYGSDVFEYSSAGCKRMREKVNERGASLFLSGVGGPQFDNFLKYMRPGGSDVVCYGAQNGAGLFLSGSNLIYPEVTVHGFYLPKYLAALTYEQRQAKLESVLDTLASANFSYPVITASSLEKFCDVWDSMFVQGGKKGVIAFS